MSDNAKYEMILQKLSEECGVIFERFVPELHRASHEDHGSTELSHLQLVRKIQKDCIHLCAELAHRITFDGTRDQDVISEILEYNYDKADIEHMIRVENMNLFSHLQQVNKDCVKRSDPEWSEFGISERLQNGKANSGPIGSKRTQFCKFCGEQIYIIRGELYDR